MYVVRRIGIFLLSLVIASMLVFGVMSILPGDPATVILGTRATPEAVESLRVELGLDRPIAVQYFDWFSHAIRGDLGESVFTGKPIGPQVVDRLKITVPLAFFALILTMLISFPLGVFAASRHRQAGDAVVSVVSQLGLAVPAFWAGLMLVTLFAVRLRWFPASGFPGWGESFFGSIEALILPAIALAIVQSAIITRYVRSAVLETMREEYIRTARSKGLTRSQALWRHGLRNASIPVLTILGLQFGALLAGTVVIESVFVLPGLGKMLLDGISRRDLPLVQGGAFVIVGIILLINLAIDLSYRLLDPRLRSH
ncbi:MAG: ABC transporter permease [Acidimicrobiia bacterium]|nr:ABC transporter permease [Acidimicrobiia bacterium]